MNKITPHLWFDTQAVEAARFYASVFPDSSVTGVSTIHDTPSGNTDIVSFELFAQPFMAISAGPLFKFTPAVSFLIACESSDEVDRYWSKLSDGGKPLMPLDSYPFSERYGWTEDRYGLSWQVMQWGSADTQKITPSLMFVGDVCGKADEAIRHYTSLFPNSTVGEITRYGPDEAPDQEGTVKFGTFNLAGTQLAAMESAHPHEFTFNEAVSLMVMCDSQQEIDHYWEGLSAVPEAEQCGWLKDRFGVSWQVTPSGMQEMLTKGSKDQIANVTQAFLKMKKFDIAGLQEAFDRT